MIKNEIQAFWNQSKNRLKHVLYTLQFTKVSVSRDKPESGKAAEE